MVRLLVTAFRLALTIRQWPELLERQSREAAETIRALCDEARRA